MDILQESFIVDGCIFSEGEFSGCAPDVLSSGLNSMFLTVSSSDSFCGAVREMGRINNLADDPEYNLRVIHDIDDLKCVEESGEIGLILWFQDPHPMGNDLNLLRVFYQLGLRVMQLTYNQANYLGTGCTEQKDRGLTEFGAEVIHELNRLGMVVDLSHSSRQTALDAITQSQDPVIFSHANPRSVTDNPRNKSDDELKLVAQKGGVIGLTPWGPLCWKGCGRPSLDDYIDHIDYLVNLVGIDHVGFGSDNTPDHSSDQSGTSEQAALYPSVVSDYNSAVGTAPSVRHARGFSGPHQLDNLVEGLTARGYSDSDISKLLGGNFLRVFTEVWKQ